jgi:5'-deoxynucleotidase YfbR-like HD superfamily hydrolase
MSTLWSDAIEGRRDITLTTYTGRIINVLDPQPEDICLDDIAHGLSLLCRYAGQLNAFYSVAEHSVFCAEYAVTHHDVALARLMLLHDAAEAYVGDVIGPVKGAMRSMGGREFDFLEVGFARAIAARFGLAPRGEFAHQVFEEKLVKDIDKRACAREQLTLRKMPEGWRVGVDPLPFDPCCWRPSRAEREFLDLAERLGITSDDAKSPRPEGT